MTVDLRDFPEEGLVLEGREPPGLLELGPSDGVQEVEPVGYRVRVRVVGRELVAMGEVSGRVRLQCGRCAEPFVFLARDPEFAAVREIDAASGDPQFVDLTPEVRESILLAFPSSPVCREDCKGLCPRCGANRNRERCGCVGSGAPRWSALDGLKL